MITFKFYKKSDVSKATEIFSKYGIDYSGCNQVLTISRNELRSALKALNEVNIVDYDF